MFADTRAFSGFSVDDVARAQEFYGGTLGLRTSQDHGMLVLHLAGDRDTLVYPRTITSRPATRSSTSRSTTSTRPWPSSPVAA